MKQIRVKLSEIQVWQAKQAAHRRGIFSRGHGIQTQKVDEKHSDQEIDLIGITGEIAVAKWFLTEIQLQPGPDEGWDTYIGPWKVQVKSTKHSNGRLLMSSMDELQADVAILAIVESEDTVRLAGWASSKDWKEKAVRVSLAGRDGYAMDQESLRPIHELMVELRKREIGMEVSNG